VMRVALAPEQVAGYSLPPAPGKATDSRAAALTGGTRSDRPARAL
jgi:hypothetical protein